MDIRTFITGFASIRNLDFKINGNSVFKGNNLLRQSAEEAYTILKISYPKFYKMDTLCQLGFLASELLVSHYGKLPYSPTEVAVVLANKNSSLDTDIAFQESISKMASPALFVYTLPNIVTGEICIRNGWKGENAFFVQESFDTGFLSGYIDTILQKGNTKACLGGWIDVMGEDHDVFLYLVEKVKRGDAVEHSDKKLWELYTRNYGSIDGRSESTDH